MKMTNELIKLVREDVLDYAKNLTVFNVSKKRFLELLKDFIENDFLNVYYKEITSRINDNSKKPSKKDINASLLRSYKTFGSYKNTYDIATLRIIKEVLQLFIKYNH